MGVYVGQGRCCLRWGVCWVCAWLHAWCLHGCILCMQADLLHAGHAHIPTRSCGLAAPPPWCMLTASVPSHTHAVFWSTFCHGCVLHPRTSWPLATVPAGCYCAVTAVTRGGTSSASPRQCSASLQSTSPGSAPCAWPPRHRRSWQVHTPPASLLPLHLPLLLFLSQPQQLELELRQQEMRRHSLQLASLAHRPRLCRSIARAWLTWHLSLNRWDPVSR